MRVWGSELVARSRVVQMNASTLLTELLKSEDLPSVAHKYVDSLTEEFFMVASAYIDMVSGVVAKIGKLVLVMHLLHKCMWNEIRAHYKTHFSYICSYSISSFLPVMVEVSII